MRPLYPPLALPLPSTFNCIEDEIRPPVKDYPAAIMKPTQALFKRVARHALSTKQANKGYYKGTGSGSMGRHTEHGGYIIELEKVRTYVVPKNLKDFKV
jgi:hypothetical protein